MNPHNPFNVTTFPTLFKKTNTGAIQFWEISVHPCCCGEEGKDIPAEIITNYGQLGTDSPQCTIDVVEEGKNTGKKNATTALEQAIKEAEAKWTKQKKKGYVDSPVRADEGDLDEVIEGGIVPMLAHTFEKQGKKISYPCYTQPKLDGIRMIAIVKNGKCTLWSRTRKPINSLPHIVAEIEKVFEGENIVLDGEAYNHKFKSNFEHIVHLVRQDEPDLECTDVEYHIYDIAEADVSFRMRNMILKEFFGDTNFKFLKKVPTFVVSIEEEVSEFYQKFKDEGYEGAMLRNSDGLYVGKRSTDLIKVKEMQDAEFEIVRVEEGRGKLSGHVGAFVCRTSDGQEFKAKMSGDTKKLKEYFDNHSLWQGKLLTVQFQDLTSYGIPRFPVGLRLREDL